MPRDSAPTPRRRRLAASTGVAAVALTVKPRPHRAANGDEAITRTPQRVQAQVVARGSRWAQTVAALALSDALAQRVTGGSDHAGRTGLDALKALCDGASPDEAKALRRMLFDRAAPTGGIDPDLELAPDWRKGAYPYRKLMSRRHYERQKYRLQVGQLKLQAGVKETGQRVAILFEGRNAAGKGGAAKRFMEHLNPRRARVVALDKPSDVGKGRWYFQRHISQLPTAGEIVLFDRS